MLEFAGDLVRELAARDWITFLVPVLCRNLPSQSMRDNTTWVSIPTWGDLLRGYPGNLIRTRQLICKAGVNTINVPTTGTK